MSISPSTYVNSTPTKGYKIKEWVFIDNRGVKYEIFEAYHQRKNGNSVENTLIFRKALELYLPAPTSNTTSVNLKSFIDANNASGYDVIKIYNLHRQPTVYSGDLSGLDVTLINNSDIQGYDSGYDALIITSQMTLENNGRIMGAGGVGGRGGGRSEFVSISEFGWGWESSPFENCTNSNTQTRRWWKYHSDYEGRWHPLNECNCCNFQYRWCTTGDTIDFAGTRVYKAEDDFYIGPRNNDSVNQGDGLRINNKGVQYWVRKYAGGVGGVGQSYKSPAGPLRGRVGFCGETMKRIMYTNESFWRTAPCPPNSGHTRGYGEIYIGGYYRWGTGEDLSSQAPCNGEGCSKYKAGDGGSGGGWGSAGMPGTHGAPGNDVPGPQPGQPGGKAIRGVSFLTPQSKLGTLFGGTI